MFKFRRPEFGKVVRCLPDKKNKISPGYLAVAIARIAPKICQDQLRTMCPECSRFYPNRFTSGGVTAEYVNTVETRDSVSNIPLKPSFEPNNNENQQMPYA